MSMKEFELAVEDCTDSLKYNEGYVKVLIRRSQAFEKLEKYEDAIADAKTVQKLEPSYPKIEVHIKRLEQVNEQKMEEMKAEAMGKLKELGNSVLGFMGMKLDDFKFAQDPNTGSWNISTNPGSK
jgi:tetratricopeptide (TPR) repeat protein